jgi:hypothetical protein
MNLFLGVEASAEGNERSKCVVDTGTDSSFVYARASKAARMIVSTRML